MSLRQQIIDLLTELGPLTQREIADQLGMDIDDVRGYIGSLRQRRPGVLYVHSYRRDADGGRLYPRALWAAGDQPDAPRIRRLSKSEYNRRGKLAMKRRIASVFHLGMVNTNNAAKRSFNDSFKQDSSWDGSCPNTPGAQSASSAGAASTTASASAVAGAAISAS